MRPCTVCTEELTSSLFLLLTADMVFEVKAIKEQFWCKGTMLKDPHEHRFIQGPPGQIVDS